MSRMHHWGTAAAHTHNVTTLVREALSQPPAAALGEGTLPVRRRRGGSGGDARERHALPDSVDADAPNLALFQITAALPASMEVVFTGSLPGGTTQVRAHAPLLPPRGHGQHRDCNACG